MKKISIVILNWNAAQDTIQCLRQFDSWQAVHVDIWVVDNASVDGSADQIEQACPGVRLIRNPQNEGFSGGTNRGIQSALAQGDAAFGGTVHEMIQLGRHPYQRRFAPDPREQAWVEQAAAQLQISAWLNRPMRTLSSGMQQRVHLARLWVQQTPLLLLDEPLAHLDWPARYFVMEWLQQLAQRENRTILVSAHDVGLALRYADTALLLLGQNRWAWGSPEQLGAEGHLTDLYGAEGLSYDPEAQDLRPVQSDRPAVQLWAPDNLRPWLCHAAERCGWRVEPAAEVQLHAQDAGFQMVFPDGRTQQVRGWSQLADLLRQAGPRV